MTVLRSLYQSQSIFLDEMEAFFSGKWVSLFFSITYAAGITYGSSLTWSGHESHLLFQSGKSLSGTLLPLLFSLLTCFPFPAPAVYGDGDVALGHSGHPRWEKQRSPERHTGHAHGYPGPGHWSGDGNDHRLCHKPLPGPAPKDLHSNCWLGNGRLHVSDLFCFYIAQLTRRGAKPKRKQSWSLCTIGVQAWFSMGLCLVKEFSLDQVTQSSGFSFSQKGCT